ncbi:hypothetical protein TNCV_1468811 [Trichonephila clavipes]|uniref:Uncharacterized protein n=1 Tax=Trichonephila clavipes TaxID=2585209 RepID=A0A8X6V783_TRICX|nr:hypothetical protein TNCV_1468811 [Trichonephila clavipes]
MFSKVEIRTDNPYKDCLEAREIDFSINRSQIAIPMMWSNESHYTLFCMDRRRRICGEPHYYHESISPYSPVQGSGGSTIRDTFCWHENGALMFLENKKPHIRYLNILADQVPPEM